MQKAYLLRDTFTIHCNIFQPNNLYIYIKIVLVLTKILQYGWLSILDIIWWHMKYYLEKVNFVPSINDTDHGIKLMLWFRSKVLVYDIRNIRNVELGFQELSIFKVSFLYLFFFNFKVPTEQYATSIIKLTDQEKIYIT